MKPTSLLALAQGFKTVPASLSGAFEAQLAERDEPLDTIKEHEARSVVALVEALHAAGTQGPRPFEGFVFSFRIPQISSEFDLLKVCDGTVVDIELKIGGVGTDRIERQLMRNRYYLAPLERTTYTFTYVVEEDLLYEMGEAGLLAQVPMSRLTSVLDSLGRPYEGRVEDLFKASNYLVSPLNDTERFLEGSYFLTNHQAQIKASFVRDSQQATGTRPVVYLVYGSAGTGKSLLLYDLAKELAAVMGGQPTAGSGQRPVCVMHCGLLSEGHRQLDQRQDGFRIISAKGMEHVGMRGYRALLVDEAQRLWPSQLRLVVQQAVVGNTALYLSLGPRQVGVEGMGGQATEQLVRSLFAQVSVWELSRKIRTNRALADFVRALFCLPGHPAHVATRDVKVSCADGPHGAAELVEAYRNEGYQYIAYTGSHADGPCLDEVGIQGCPTASDVVGQEFDRVVMVVGRRFSNEDERLYHQLLFQGLTRARNALALVVLDNEPLLERLLGILG